MAKAKRPTPKASGSRTARQAPGAKPATASRRWWVGQLALLAIALAAQLTFLKWRWHPSDRAATGATDAADTAVGAEAADAADAAAAAAAANARRLSPSICPSDWTTCPRQGGIDWPSVLAVSASVDAARLAGCNATALLSAQRVEGMHSLCVIPPAEEEAALLAATVAIYKNMERLPAHDPQPAGIIGVPHGLTKLSDLLGLIEYRLRLPARLGDYQPRALFTDTGVRLKTLGGALLGLPKRLLLIDGGQWLWPPVEVGHVHLIPDLTAPGKTTRVVTISLKPLIVEVEDFLTEQESQHIIDRASPHMAKSGVSLKDVDKGKAAKEFRTSSQYFLPTDRDPVLERIDRRVSFLTRIPIAHAEYIQVLRYNHMEHYSAHHDFFDPKAYASNRVMIESVQHGARNRLATVFFYLNNITAGGQTNFPRAATAAFPHGGPQPRDYFDCTKGVSVFPQAGKVIIFYSLLPSGDMDDLSLHGGCDVLTPGESKWSANFWLWNKPSGFTSAARQRVTAEMEREYL